MKKVNIQSLFNEKITITKNLIHRIDDLSGIENNQSQTKDIFSDKWETVSKFEKIEETFEFQRKWFLELYGFVTEENLKNFLKNKNIIVDYGSGLGYKSAWFAKLAPHATVIGIEISDSVYIASKKYDNFPNLYFFKGDIAKTGFKENIVDFSVCDQVIMHTENPDLTFSHIAAVTSKQGVFACYVYSKKALPRELIDDYFRLHTHSITPEQMWEFSKQITVLGRTLSELNIKFIAPDIPLLGIKGGEYDLQRFIYWNFLKCFWNDELGYEISYGTNFDWYAPSNAKRYSKNEFLDLVNRNSMYPSFFHEEEACYSGCFQFKK
jgi:ubiquinone/menaquinone biosynthesis C-methylase UbiE